jgi:hypothetical protein
MRGYENIWTKIDELSGERRIFVRRHVVTWHLITLKAGAVARATRCVE